ncbi:uncharacterized protein LOC117783844 [Drosophila innubila]|uniref:uncharacterized protein LOC117783844 n=1 Tax=Drosophila innubila TaxID=198719 RepID=UPI00148E75FE|nr:uncharacterized protein LOC117783844 [Drosophila innubila]
MNTKISVVLLLLVGCSLQRVYSEDTTPAPTPTTKPTGDTTVSDAPTTVTPPFSTCPAFAGKPVDLKAISGDWYEAGRAPDVDVSQCLKYTLPSTPNANSKLEVQLEFVNTADNKWDHMKETGLLPWDANAQNGIFNWNAGETVQIPVTLKLVDTDAKSYAFVCGYTGVAPTPIFKVLTRKRELSTEDKNKVQEQFNTFVPVTKLIWVEQSEAKCNSAMRSAGGFIVALALVLLIRQRNH